MAFIFKPVNNYYINQREAREIITRLVTEAVNTHKISNPTGCFAKSIVNPQGSMFDFEKDANYNTTITVNLDLNDSYNQKIRDRRDDQSKSYTVMATISIARKLDERTQSELDLINEYLEKAICFNLYIYETTLTALQGFSKNTYKINLNSLNKLDTAKQLDTQTQLQSELKFLIKINRQ